MSTKSLIEAIKEKLRAKNLTYAQLAKGIGVSESTVKRMFNAASDITLGRLEEICKFLNISLAELLDRPIPSDPVSFTGEQEEALSSDLDLLHLFYASLSINDMRDLASFSKKDQKAVRSAMKSLERLGLLRRDIGDKVRSNVRSWPQWSPKGPLMRKVFPNLRHDLISSDFEGELEQQVLRYLLVSPESAQVIRKKLLALLLEFAELSKLDLRFARDRVIPWSIYFASRPHTPSFFEGSNYPSQKTLKRLIPSA